MIIVFSIVFTSNVFSTNLANEDYLSNEYSLNNFVEVSEDLLEDYPFRRICDNNIIYLAKSLNPFSRS